MKPKSVPDTWWDQTVPKHQSLEERNVSVQFSRSVISNSLWPMDCSMPGLPVHHQLPEFTQTHVHWVGDAIQPSHPLSPPIPPSIRVFSNESTLRIRWPKYWSCSFSISPSKEVVFLICSSLPYFQKSNRQSTLAYRLTEQYGKLLQGLEIFNYSKWVINVMMTVMTMYKTFPSIRKKSSSTLSFYRCKNWAVCSS